MFLHNEILSQPAVLHGLLETQLAAVQQVAQAIRQRDIRYVYLAARGTSEHAGIYGQYLLGALNRLPVALAAPSLFTLYGQPPNLRDALVIGVSQSGQSPDIVSVLEEGQRQGALTLAITNAPDPPLAHAARLTLNISAGEERAVAATKTYTAQLLTFAMLAAALSGSAERLAALAQVPGAVAAALALEPQMEQASAAFQTMAHCVVLGRGYHFATALEWSLKLKELAYVVAERYSTAEFQHGPIALVEASFPVLAVVGNDAATAATVALLARLAEEQGAQVLALADTPISLPPGQIVIEQGTNLPPWLAPIAAMVPAQLFCYHMARANGLNPDAPRGLRKVTRTR